MVEKRVQMRRFVARNLNRLTENFGISCTRSKDFQRLVLQKDLFARLLRPREKQAYSSTASGIVFSMDRACQMHALLTSYFALIPAPPHLTVIYSSSNSRHDTAYQTVKTLFRKHPITWIRESDFRKDLLEVLGKLESRWVFFLVDDIIWTRPVDFTVFDNLDSHHYVPSLRLGKHVNYCYTKQKPMKQPKFSIFPNSGKDLLEWKWGEGNLDWGYPLSVDGHLFCPEEIRIIADSTDFRKPNTFEIALQNANPVFRMRRGICFSKSRLVNLPINKVQSETKNLHGQVDAEFLLKQWEENKQIDTDSLTDINNESVHQEFPVSMIHRVEKQEENPQFLPISHEH